MGRRGPPKKPTEQKKLQGVPGGKHKLPKGEPTPAVVTNATPQFPLSKRAEEIFFSLAPILQRNNLYTVADTVAFHRYCNLLDKWLQYDAILQGAPMVKGNLGGGEQPNPALKAFESIGKDLLRLEKEFGMTPAARASLGVVGNQDAESEKEKTKKLLYG